MAQVPPPNDNSTQGGDDASLSTLDPRLRKAVGVLHQLEGRPVSASVRVRRKSPRDRMAALTVKRRFKRSSSIPHPLRPLPPRPVGSAPRAPSGARADTEEAEEEESGDGGGAAQQPTAATTPLQQEDASVHTEEESSAEVAESAEAKRIRRRGNVVAEIVETEDRYVSQLTTLIERYMRPLKKSEEVSDAEVRTLFGNVETLYQIHAGLLRRLRERQRASPHHFEVGDIMEEITPLLTLYVDYINGFDAAGQLLEQLQRKRSVNAVLESLSHENLRGVTALEILRVTPIQRVPRYVLLLRELLKYCDPESDEFEAVKRAHAAMEKTTAQINEKKREAEKAARMLSIAEHLRGNLGPLRDTHANNVEEEKMHDFKSRTFRTVHACDFCHQAVSLSGYRCRVCRYNCHSDCMKFVPRDCGAEREKRPELIRAHRHLVAEFAVEHKMTPLDKPSALDKTPYEQHLVVVFSDALAVIRQPDPEREDYELIDLVKFSHREARWQMEVKDNVAKQLFSVSNPRMMRLHTFRAPSAAQKEEWVGIVRKASDEWNAHSLRRQQQEQEIVKRLQGVQFAITGQVPVHSTYEKPFTVYIVEMTKDGETVVLLKRYRQLLVFHNKLKKVYGEANLPRFPGKKLFGNTDPRFVQKRCRKISAYLDGIVKLEGVFDLAFVRLFLTTTVSKDHEDELVPTFHNLHNIPLAERISRRLSVAPSFAKNAAAAAAPSSVSTASPLLQRMRRNTSQAAHAPEPTAAATEAVSGGVADSAVSGVLRVVQENEEHSEADPEESSSDEVGAETHTPLKPSKPRHLSVPEALRTFVIALWNSEDGDLQPQDPGDVLLQFKQNDRIEVLSGSALSGDGWFFGRLERTGEKGWVPASWCSAPDH